MRVHVASQADSSEALVGVMKCLRCPRVENGSIEFFEETHKFRRKNMKRKQATRKHQIFVLNHVLVRNDGGIQKGHEIGITHFFGSA